MKGCLTLMEFQPVSSSLFLAYLISFIALFPSFASQSPLPSLHYIDFSAFLIQFFHVFPPEGSLCYVHSNLQLIVSMCTYKLNSHDFY